MFRFRDPYEDDPEPVAKRFTCNLCYGITGHVHNCPNTPDEAEADPDDEEREDEGGG